MQPPLAIAIASAEPASNVTEARNAPAASACKASPLQRGSLRCWRKPSQTSAAPSSANVQAVERAESASGTASVANPIARMANDSPSVRIDARRISTHASSVYTAASASAQ